MGSTWVEEMREELKFAMICHGNTKVGRFSRQDILEKFINFTLHVSVNCELEIVNF